MWLLPINSFFPVYLMLLLLLGISNGVYGQLVTSDQVAKEGDDEVVLPCDYSQVTPTTPNKIAWNEVNEVGRQITPGIATDVKPISGRYSLRTTSGKADLVIANPIRNDTQRRFQCQIQTPSGDVYDSDPPSIITVYYLDEPVLSASASSVYEGESVTLICSKPDGDPVPNIAWYKDGQSLITTDTTRFDTSDDALEIHIKAATPIDGGRYTCKAESDQFKGEDGKTSNQIDLKVIYLSVTFQSQAGIAACTAEGHPMPSSIIINKDGKMIEKGEATVSVMITEEICQSNITCYAENGEVNVTESLKTCYKDLNVKFESEAGIATCTAEGYPMPSSVMIYIDGKMIDKGEVEAKIVINEEICQSNITCYAENGEFNATESLEICNTDESISALLVALIVVIAIIMPLWVLLLLYFIYGKNIEMAGEDVTAVEGDPSLVMSINYRPSIAHFESIQWDKNEEEAGSQKWKTQGIGSFPKLFSSRTFFFKYICRCCFYFCGPCCSEYRDDSYERVEMGNNKRKSQGRTYEALEMQENYCERGIGDGQTTDILDCPESSAELLAEPPAEVPKPREENETQMKDEPTLNESTLNAVTDKKGLDPCEEAATTEPPTTAPPTTVVTTEVATSAPPTTVVTTEYAATTAPPTTVVTIEEKASGQNIRDDNTHELHHSNTNRCSVTTNGRGTISLKISKPVRSDEGEYKCSIVRGRQQYQHVNNVIVYWIEMVQEDYNAEIGDDFEMKTKPTWMKISEDGTSDIDDLSNVTTDNKGNSMLKISKVTCADAGKYQFLKSPFKLEIPYVTTNGGINIVKLYLNITAEDEASLKDISNITWYKGESRENGNMLTSLKSSGRSERHQTRFEKEKSEASLSFKDVTTKDAGRYFCEVAVEGRQKIYSCSGLLKVEESLLQFVNSRQKSIAGEDVNIFCQLSTQRPIKKFIFSKMKFGKLKEVATSDRLIDNGRFEAQCSKEHNGGFLLISKVQISDAGTYHCQCVTEDKIDDEYISYSATSQLKIYEKELALEVPSPMELKRRSDKLSSEENKIQLAGTSPRVRVSLKRKTYDVEDEPRQKTALSILDDLIGLQDSLELEEFNEYWYKLRTLTKKYMKKAIALEVPSPMELKRRSDKLSSEENKIQLAGTSPRVRVSLKRKKYDVEDEPRQKTALSILDDLIGLQDSLELEEFNEYWYKLRTLTEKYMKKAKELKIVGIEVPSPMKSEIKTEQLSSDEEENKSQLVGPNQKELKMVGIEVPSHMKSEIKTEQLSSDEEENRSQLVGPTQKELKMVRIEVPSNVKFEIKLEEISGDEEEHKSQLIGPSQKEQKIVGMEVPSPMSFEIISEELSSAVEEHTSQHAGPSQKELKIVGIEVSSPMTIEKKSEELSSDEEEHKTELDGASQMKIEELKMVGIEMSSPLTSEEELSSDEEIHKTHRVVTSQKELKMVGIEVSSPMTIEKKSEELSSDEEEHKTEQAGASQKEHKMVGIEMPSPLTFERKSEELSSDEEEHKTHRAVTSQKELKMVGTEEFSSDEEVHKTQLVGASQKNLKMVGIQVPSPMTFERKSEELSNDEEDHNTNRVRTSQIVDCDGGNLKLGDSDIELHIPAGAIEEGMQVDISIGYYLEDTNVPVTNDLESRISPIVACGPGGTVFNKDILLSFPHNAVNEESWTFTLLVKKSAFGTWKRIGDDKDTTLSVRNGRCFITTNHFTLWTVIVESLMELILGRKILRLGLFGKMLEETYQLRVRIWNKYDEQLVLEEERTNDEIALDIPKQMAAMYTDMDISIDELDDGWEVDEESEVTLNAYLIWNAQPCHKFHLNITDKSKRFHRARISISQEGSTICRVPLRDLEHKRNKATNINSQKSAQVSTRVERHAPSSPQHPIPVESHASSSTQHMIPVESHASSSTQLPSPEITESDYRSLLNNVSTWWKKYGNINMLKVLLRQFMSKLQLLDLQRTDNVMDLFKLLEATGELSKSKFTIIFAVVKLCGLEGVDRNIREILPLSFQSFNERDINIFSIYRQKLIRFGRILKKESIKTIGGLTDINEEVYQGDQWLLICELEDKEKINENSLADFIKLLRANDMGIAAKILE